MTSQATPNSLALVSGAAPSGVAHVATFVLDNRGLITHYSGDLSSHTGIPPQPLGKDIDSFPPPWSEFFLEASAEGPRQGHKSGRIATQQSPALQVFSYPVDDKGGVVWLIFRDEPLSSPHLSSRLHDLGKWTRSFVHSLNNTLFGLSGYADLGLKSTDGAMQRRVLTMVKEATRRITNQAAVLQRFGRHIEEAPPGEECTLTEAVDHAFGLIEASGRSTADVEFLRDEHVSLVGPAMTIAQILANLIDNALDAVRPTGGKISLRVEESAAHVDISVCDEGPGLEPALAERVFMPFVSLKRTTTHGEAHPGLGLTLAQSMALEIGGSLTLVSTPGQGTRVTLRCRRSTSTRATP